MKRILIGALALMLPAIASAQNTTTKPPEQVITEIERLIADWRTPPVVTLTFGKTTIGGTFNSFPAANSKSVSRFTLVEGATIQNVTAYFKGTDPGHEGGNARAVIYRASDNTLVAQSNEVAVSDGVDEWIAFGFATAPVLAAGDYDLGIISGTRLVGAMDVGGTNRFALDAYADGASATFLSPTASTMQKSIYATYTRTVVPDPVVVDPDPEPDPAPDPSAACTVNLTPTSALQAAITAAAPGAVLCLAAGDYPGTLRITKALTIRFSGTMPQPSGTRIVPTLTTNDDVAQMRAKVQAVAAGLPRITVAGGNVPAFEITGSDVLLMGVVIRGTGTVHTLVACGNANSTQNTLALVPRRITLDRVIVEGDPSNGVVRAIAANCGDLTVKDSTVTDVRRVGQDAQTIGGWNGPGPFTFKNNFLSGGTETLMFGGAVPNIPQLVPADIIIEDNVLTFPLEWRATTGLRKTVLELKAAKRVTIRRNVIENSWVDAQIGYCVTLTPTQQSASGGAFTAVTVEDVLFERNIIRHCSGAVNLLGFGQNQSTHPTQTSARITFRNNYVYDIDRALGGHGVFVSIGNGPIDLVLETNTVFINGDAMIRKNDAIPMPGFRMTGNLVVPVGTYGFFLGGNPSSTRCDANMLGTHMPGAVVSGNAFAGAISTMRTNPGCPTNNWITDATGLFDAATGITSGALAPYGVRPPQ